MRNIKFYRTVMGKCPVENFLDTLTDTQVTKITWVLKLIKELDVIPKKYFKKLVNTNSIWEVRIEVGNNTFRILGFVQKGDLLLLTNSFQKKTQKIPINEISIAEKRKVEYLSRGYKNG